MFLIQLHINFVESFTPLNFVFLYFGFLTRHTKEKQKGVWVWFNYCSLSFLMVKHQWNFISAHFTTTHQKNKLILTRIKLAGKQAGSQPGWHADGRSKREKFSHFTIGLLFLLLLLLLNMCVWWKNFTQNLSICDGVVFDRPKFFLWFFFYLQFSEFVNQTEK